jgi:hypothetical protein
VREVAEPLPLLLLLERALALAQAQAQAQGLEQPAQLMAAPEKVFLLLEICT